ncbi:four-carbon acid sugar kinase family protein [Nonomuraea phyllanthi]|uniref:four-carbon acid sugar kinase family protein n=1 Tax=Nonomuraea phyllanthi TaxID=2219224 RepID=UPI001293C742|nr:four-carbon acid sugar kinase family protein [Nonomuraea phyllanthi]QFY07487.1 four-carbon acid sugar kinase family protein [Nonomuraea phyllanthi]
MTLFAFVADDFTGATDALWQFRRFGLTGSLVTDVAHLHDGDDVIGLATTARAEPDPVATVLPAFKALAALEPLVMQYKVCSTFDSSPSHGSIGAVIAALRREGLARGPVPVLAAQPELGRYTWFANHFVRVGAEVQRLDRYPPMRDHPVTPASEADLRLRLAEQGAGPVGWLPASPSGEAYRGLDGEAAFVADAVTEEHVRALGRVLLSDAVGRAPLFCVGSGGLSYALASAHTDPAPEPDGADGPNAKPGSAVWPDGEADPRPGGVVRGGPGRVLEPATPVLVVSGSRSPITARQIDTAERAGWHVLDASVDHAPGAYGKVLAQVMESLRDGRHTIVQSTRGPSRDPAGIGEQLGRLASDAVGAGLVGRLVVAGGDTSGQVVASLGARSLDVVASLAPGAPVCVLTSDNPACDGLEVALKGGQVGGNDYFLAVAAEGGVELEQRERER